jgi:predicted DNA-binding transcriptional regulator AlpA
MRAVEAAKLLQVSRSTLAKWRMRGEGPPYHRCGPRIVFYYDDELAQWQNDCDEREKKAKTDRKQRPPREDDPPGFKGRAK